MSDNPLEHSTTSDLPVPIPGAKLTFTIGETKDVIIGAICRGTQGMHVDMRLDTDIAPGIVFSGDTVGSVYHLREQLPAGTHTVALLMSSPGGQLAQVGVSQIMIREL